MLVVYGRTKPPVQTMPTHTKECYNAPAVTPHQSTYIPPFTASRNTCALLLTRNVTLFGFRYVKSWPLEFSLTAGMNSRRRQQRPHSTDQPDRDTKCRPSRGTIEQHHLPASPSSTSRDSTHIRSVNRPTIPRANSFRRIYVHLTRPTGSRRWLQP